MTTSSDDQTGPVPAPAGAPRAQSYHTPALILLWIVIILGCFFIWPSKSYLSGEPPPVTAPAQR